MLLVVASAVFLAWTFYRLRRLDRKGPVFRQGVLGFGLSMWAFMTFLMTHGASQSHPDRPVAYFAGVFGLSMLPICLWAGYWWGQGMAAWFSRR